MPQPWPGLFCCGTSGWAQRTFFAAWEGGSWVASFEVSLRDGNLGTFSFSVILFVLGMLVMGINLSLLSKTFVNMLKLSSERVHWLGMSAFLRLQLEGNHSGGMLLLPSSPCVGGKGDSVK